MDGKRKIFLDRTIDDTERKIKFAKLNPLKLKGKDNKNAIIQYLKVFVFMFESDTNVINKNTNNSDTDSCSETSDNEINTDSNDKFDSESWFWDHIDNKKDYYSIEVYNISNNEIIELINIVKNKLAK